VSARCKRPRGGRKPETKAIDLGELEDIIERAGSGPLSEADRAKLEETVKTLAWMQHELANKDLTLARLRSLFGLSKSEKTKTVLGNDSDREPEGQDEDDQDQKSKREPKKKVKGHGRNAAEEYKGADRVVCPHDSLEPGDPCPECPSTKQGKLYELGPSVLVRITGQAPVHATRYEQQRLRCNLCGKVFVADPPPGIGDQKYDAKSASMIALLRYGSGMPFNRLEGLQGNLEIPLPASTQWDIVNDAALQIVPAYEELIRQGAQGDLVHNDDTSMQVLDLRKKIDELKKAGETDRTGIFSTSIVCRLENGHNIALFFTGRNHAGENLTELLRQRAAELEPPVQMCDGLDRNLSTEFETILANCLVHARRNFVEVVDSFPDQVRHVLETLGAVYKNDADAKKLGLSAEERLHHHQERSGPLMSDLRDWMDEQLEEKRIEPNSSLGRAIHYMKKRWKELTQFLHIPGAPLDNNIAERAIKKAITHRKNSLFYKTENGARVGDIFMSLIHTAELARKNAFHYLTALIENASAVATNPSRWLPWTYEAAVREAMAADAPAADHGAGAPGR